MLSYLKQIKSTWTYHLHTNLSGAFLHFLLGFLFGRMLRVKVSLGTCLMFQKKKY